MFKDYLLLMEKVEEFYRKFNQDEFLNEKGIEEDRLQLRTNLFKEETDELIKAVKEKDRVEILDAIIDMLYIRIGTILEHTGGKVLQAETICEIDIEIQNTIETFKKHFGDNFILLIDGFNEVQKSNLSKLDKDGNPIFREDGKIMKSELFVKPDLKTILEKYGEL